jgi:hypothetical protein
MRIYTLNRTFLLVFGNKNLRLDAISLDFHTENLSDLMGRKEPPREKMNIQTYCLGKSSENFEIFLRSAAIIKNVRNAHYI